MTVTLFATAVAYAFSRGINITLSNSVVPLFSVVVSTLKRVYLVAILTGLPRSGSYWYSGVPLGIRRFDPH